MTRAFCCVWSSVAPNSPKRPPTAQFERRLFCLGLQSLSRTLVELLSLSLTLVPTRVLTSALVPSLTHTLAPIVTHALTHDRKTDYYCFYCKTYVVHPSQCGMTYHT